MTRATVKVNGGDYAIMELPVAVKGILAWWIARVQDVLGENLHSVVLFGSVTLGDFQSEWSDVDACVILHRPIMEAEGKAIGHVHDEMKERFARNAENGWASEQVVEGPYIPLALARGQKQQAACYVAGGTTRRWDVFNPISPFDRYMLANHGHLFFGRQVDFVPPNKEDLVQQTETDLETLRDWRDKSALWLASELHWFARCIVFWRDGRMLSKTAALEHEISHSSPYAEAFRLALDLRHRGAAAVERSLEALKRHFGVVADDAAEDIREHIMHDAESPGNRAL